MKYSGGRSIDFPSFTIRADDGTRLRYYDSGLVSERDSLPVVILANGLGGPASAWLPYLERWRNRYRIISWDYRGSYGSLVQVGADLSVAAHAKDLNTILDRAAVDEAFYLGWSMGVQVGLEFYQYFPRRLTHLALVSGTFGRPLRSVPLPFAERALPPLLGRAGRFSRWGRSLLDGVSQSPLSYRALRRLGLVAAGLRESHYRIMIDDFKSIDLELYFRLLGELGKHDAEASLRRIDIPSLVVAGSRDFLTPPTLARKIAAEIRSAELFVIPGATHYSTVEYPELIMDRLESFFVPVTSRRKEPPREESIPPAV